MNFYVKRTFSILSKGYLAGACVTAPFIVYQYSHGMKKVYDDVDIYRDNDPYWMKVGSIVGVSSVWPWYLASTDVFGMLKDNLSTTTTV